MAATILLVDADSSNRSDWEALLQNHGYKVFAANNGTAALKECPRIQPDLVLMASSLPGLTGFEVCRQLKAGPQTRHTPVVMMVPSANAWEMAEGLEAGADDFWGWPASKWDALGRVQSILQLKSYIDNQAESVVLSLARSLEAKDPGTEGHSERLVGYVMQFAESLGMSEGDLAMMRLASLVHDIGKVAVPDSILFKPGRLTEGEMEIMRQHPIVSENICAPLKSFREALPVIRHHHERVDGSGYPDCLAGEQIPMGARILQIVDVFDALTTDRPYRKAMPREWALAVMMNEARRGWLDLKLFNKFRHISRTSGFPLPGEQLFTASCSA